MMMSACCIRDHMTPILSSTFAPPMITPSGLLGTCVCTEHRANECRGQGWAVQGRQQCNAGPMCMEHTRAYGSTYDTAHCSSAGMRCDASTTHQVHTVQRTQPAGHCAPSWLGTEHPASWALRTQPAGHCAPSQLGTVHPASWALHSHHLARRHLLTAALNGNGQPLPRWLIE